MVVHPEFIRGYDAASKAKQLIINSQLAELERLRTATKGLIERYCDLVNSGDCGFWNPEEEAPVIAARAALYWPL